MHGNTWSAEACSLFPEYVELALAAFKVTPKAMPPDCISQGASPPLSPFAEKQPLTDSKMLVRFTT